MKINEVKGAIEGPKVCCGDEEDGCFDDEDFYEAIDLLESARRQLVLSIKYDPINPARRHLFSKLSDDIGQFIDLFIVTEPVKEGGDGN